MNEKQKAKIIIKSLNKIYPKAPVPLKSKNTFTLLISVLLSAQCTDINVNNVTKDIYPKYYKPEHFVKLGRKKIEKLIKKIGIFRVKAKSIYFMSKEILEKHKGRVPKTFEELENLPGVGHKTASVVMSQGFGYPAFAVDTHIHRLAQRWGLTNGKNVIQTEKDLKRIFPKILVPLLVLYGGTLAPLFSIVSQQSSIKIKTEGFRDSRMDINSVVNIF